MCTQYVVRTRTYGMFELYNDATGVSYAFGAVYGMMLDWGA